MYEEIIFEDTMPDGEVLTITNIKYTDGNGDVYYIPVDENNIDYQNYLASLEA